MRPGLIALLCAGLLACDKNNGNENGAKDLADPGTGAFAVLLRSSPLAVGSAQCASGGVLVEVGADNGDGGGTARDGVLQDGEVDQATPVCAVASPVYATVTKLTPLAVGDLSCPFGGSLIEYGLDNGEAGGTANNGLLDGGEKDGQTLACLSQPSDLLVRTVEIYPGDPRCAYGGVFVQSGLDDGAPTGTKGDQILDDDEIDLEQTRCNPSPTVVFPPPTGAAGDNTIDGRGGIGAGTASAESGGGGILSIANLAGPLAGSVELHTNGTVTPRAPTSTATYAPGAHELVVSTAIDPIPVFDTPQSSGLYLLGPYDAPVDMGTVPQVALPLYDGPTPVTSIHVTSTGTLTFLDSVAYGDVKVSIPGDVLNEGTILALIDTDASPLAIECHHFLNRSTGKVGGGGSADLAIWATQGSGGQIVNEGELTTQGPDEGSSGYKGGGALNLVAHSGIFNSGKLTTRAGLNGAGGPNPSGNLILYAFHGPIRSSGTIDANAAPGDAGGRGGWVVVHAGPFVPSLNPAAFRFDSRIAPRTDYRFDQFSPLPAAYLAAPSAADYDIDLSGTISANGSAATGAAKNGGAGGIISVFSHGGSIRSTATVSANGGAANPGASRGGVGGAIAIAAATLLLPDGTIQVPSEITLAGSFAYRGGSATGTTGYQFGSAGGVMRVLLDVMLQNVTPQSTIDYGLYAYDASFDRAQLATLAVKPRVQLLGIKDVFLQGGPLAIGTGGPGGALGLVAATCIESCAFPHVGSHFVFSNTRINLDAGSDTIYPQGAQGGHFEAFEFGSGNTIPAVIEASSVELRGSITAKGADVSSDAEGGRANDHAIVATSGDVILGGAFDLRGGAAPAGRGGGGAGLYVNGFLLTVSGDLDLSGGAGLVHGAASGSNLQGYRLLVSGDVTATGSSSANLGLTGVDTLTIAGTVDFSGLGIAAPDGLNGANGSQLFLEGQSLATTGTLKATGASAGTTKAGRGGEIRARGSWSHSGGINLDGGGCSSATSCEGGRGGSLSLQGSISGGTASLRGGPASVSAIGTAQGGAGGAVEAYGVDVAVPFVLDGGNATVVEGTAFGGSGGALYARNVTAAVSIKGGTGARTSGSSAVTANGGYGGYCEIGDTTASLSVAGGDALGAGTGLTTTGGQGGSCCVTGTDASRALVSAPSGTPFYADGTVSGPICF